MEVTQQVAVVLGALTRVLSCVTRCVTCCRYGPSNVCA